MDRVTPSPNQAATGRPSTTTLANNDEDEKAYAFTLGERINSLRSDPLHSSAHLSYLAQYLRAPFQKPAKRRVPPDDNLPARYPFVTRYSLQPGQMPSPKKFIDPQDFLASDDTTRYQNEILFLTGQPSAKWLNFLGSRFSLEYLFLHRHLHQIISGPEQPWNAGPDLPSRSIHTLTLRIPTVMFLGSQGRNLQIRNLEQAREKSDSLLRRAHLSIQAGHVGDTGRTIVRRVEVHNGNTIVLEQQITAAIEHREGSWTIVLWSDAGNELGEEYIPIPATEDFDPVSSDVTICPVFFENDALEQAVSHFTPKATRLPPSKQPLALLSTRYGATMDWSKCPTDSPIAVLQELFFFQAAAILQYVNMIERVLADLGRQGDFPSYEHTKLETTVQYDYIKSSLARAEQHCSATFDFLQKLPPNWEDANHGSGDPSVIRDIEYLIGRSRSLQKVCEDGKATLINNNSVQAAKRSAREAQLVTQLTKVTNRLTFIFLPISFVTSIFGMNFDEFGQGPLPIWIWAVVTAPLLVFCVLMVERGDWIRAKWVTYRSRRRPFDLRGV